jgi:hypothetical protein
MFDFVFFLSIAVVLSGFVFSKRIHDGVIIKAGLICTSLGFLGAAMIAIEGGDKFVNALYLIGLGALTCIGGFIFRGWLTCGKCRRFTDWIIS